MPLLDATGAITDRWVRLTDDTPLPRAGAVILSVARLKAEFDQLPSHGLLLFGVEIVPEVCVDTLTPWLQRLDLIAIPFKSFTDGRGFSIARQLRLAGFAGELRAVGPLIADQFAYLKSCGFDTVQLDAATFGRQPSDQWLAALSAFSGLYQRSYGGPLNILAARRAARAKAADVSERAAAE